ncbi:MAG TPA: aminotransferase class I/II-fold pyridoxal phosphate-dependent enzyme [Candidatus Choladousia intestinavium]|uniref:Aminotransferase class I/II-fold pyridoxal phosphate-dependent enzyme n=1 Tax=Candidatus Choladousia intestinavium TaxID=2840727 RepID=A0A9D1AC80_9FIRM|nr:aminotransferase class I/II-fold pyridoxal phosphate-dependent enzyme [Candidatus Choladousia intestinavium]
MVHKHGGNLYEHKGAEDFSANINFKGMPEKVKQAALASIEESVHYPDPECTELREALAEREGLKKEQILCGNGAAELMFALAFARKPKTALLPVPSFYEYQQALKAAGCEVRYFYLKEEEEYRIAEDFLKEAEKGYDAAILGNPNNPTGKLIAGKRLEEILALCRRKGSLLMVDESFLDFLDEKDLAETFPCGQLLEKYPNLLVIKSFTKMYAMPGLRFGYVCCADEELLRQMRSKLQPWNVSLPAQRGALAAAAETDFARKTAAETAVNRQKMKEALQEAGYRVFDSCTNYLLFKGPFDLGKYCVNRKMLIRDCSNFPGLEKEFFRICIRSEEENIRLARILKERLRGQILETERLYLRLMEDADFPDLCRMLQDPQVMYAYEHAFEDEEAWEWLKRQQTRYEKDGFGLWAVIEKETGEMIGQCGLTVQDCNGRQVVEVGYLFCRSVWHQGFASEAARACRDYAFRRLEVREVYSIIRDTNLPSIKVARANGMKEREKLIKHYYGMEMPHLVYSITKEEWEWQSRL